MNGPTWYMGARWKLVVLETKLQSRMVLEYSGKGKAYQLGKVHLAIHFMGVEVALFKGMHIMCINE